MATLYNLNGSNNWFTNFTRKLGSLFRKKTDQKNNEPDLDYYYDRSFQKIGRWKFSQKKVYDKQAILNGITEDGKELREVGERDGWRGLTPVALVRITKNIASLWCSFVQNSFRQKHIIAKGRQADAELRYNSVLEKISILNKHRTFIDTHYKYSSKNYSLILGIGYIVVAVLLIYADFPLAAVTAQEGFGLPEDSAAEVAVGMVLMTVYIKIMYDEYLGNSLQKELIHKRAQNVLGEGNVATTQELLEAKKVRLIKLSVKLMILTILLATIYILGVFRFGFLEAQANVIGESNMYYNAMKSDSGKYGFILISLIFPIISGVCLSVGFTNIQNVLERFKVNFRLLILQRIQEKKLNQLLVAKGKVEECESNLEWVAENGTFLQECSDYFFSCYLHGFERGFHLRTPEDFYSAAQHFRDRSFAVNASDYFSNHVNNGSKNNFYDKFFPNQSLSQK